MKDKSLSLISQRQNEKILMSLTITQEKRWWKTEIIIKETMENKQKKMESRKILVSILFTAALILLVTDVKADSY